MVLRSFGEGQRWEQPGTSCLPAIVLSLRDKTIRPSKRLVLALMRFKTPETQFSWSGILLDGRFCSDRHCGFEEAQLISPLPLLYSNPGVERLGHDSRGNHLLDRSLRKN